MNYCPNCGEQCTQGSSFCIKCGNMLGKDVLLEPNENSSPNGNEKNTCIEVNTRYVLESLKAYWNIMVRHDKEVKKFIEEGKNQTTYILLLISLFFQSFLYLWKVNQIYNGLFSYSKNIIIKLVNSISGFVGEPMYKMDMSELMNIQGQLSLAKSYFPINNIKVFFQGALLSLIVIGVVYIGIYIISKKNNMMKILKIISISTIPVVYGGIFAILLSYVNEGLGFIVFIFSILISIGSLYTNISKYLLDGKSAILEVSLIITVLLVIVYIIAGNFFSNEIPDFINKFKGFIENYG